MRRTKRHFLQMTAASVLVLIAPIAPAQAQLQWLEPFLEAIGGISGALGIADVLTKWYSTFAPDKRCKVDLGDLANIKLDCEVLSQTLDDETIPLLKNFVINKDSRSWKRVKVSVAQMLADSEVLIGNINRVIIILDEKTYPGPREDIQRLCEQPWWYSRVCQTVQSQKISIKLIKCSVRYFLYQSLLAMRQHDCKLRSMIVRS